MRKFTEKKRRHQPGEICTQDKHFLGTELEILLKSRMSKKRRFLERADFLVAASRAFAATGQKALRKDFLSTTPPGPNNHGTLQKHTEEEPPRTLPSENIQVTDPSIQPAASLNQEQTIDNPKFYKTPTQGSDHQNSTSTAPN